MQHCVCMYMSVCMCARMCICAQTRGHQLPNLWDMEARGGDWTDAKRLKDASVTDIIPWCRDFCCATYT